MNRRAARRIRAGIREARLDLGGLDPIRNDFKATGWKLIQWHAYWRTIAKEG